MNSELNEHDLAALLNDLPEERLVCGDIGTIVMIHGGGEAFEVEFPNPAGKPRYVVVTVRKDDLLKLRNVDVNLRATG